MHLLAAADCVTLWALSRASAEWDRPHALERVRRHRRRTLMPSAGRRAATALPVQFDSLLFDQFECSADKWEQWVFSTILVDEQRERFLIRHSVQWNLV